MNQVVITTLRLNSAPCPLKPIKKEETSMVSIKRIVLDVLKPHKPGILELSKTIASLGDDYLVSLTVIDVDKKTETLEVEITGTAIEFSAIESTLSSMGASLHSVDVVEAENKPDVR
jgi:hypothetical protein